ncbi:MAG: GntR family transcriptional regulator [Acidobacteriota bacterium]
MYITIDEEDGRAIYRQVVDGIKELIARGELQQGSALPPVRQVAADLGVNLNTIAFAYRQLQQDGLIKIRHGSGAVVISKTLGEKAEGRLASQLRAALTHLVLEGLARTEINVLVACELDHLFRDRGR